MKKLYLRVFSVILALSAILFTFSITTDFFKASAATEGFSIVNGAQVRDGDASVENDDTTGIRFAANLTKTTFESITQNENNPVYFGIELTANEVSYDICYLVDSASKATTITKAINFGDSAEYTYTASITYTKEILKHDLALDSRFNSNYDKDKSDAENIANSSITESDLNAYLAQAYATEITAKAFYRVGDNGVKEYGDGEVTRSMWGVASCAYAKDSENYQALAAKYFTDSSEEATSVDAIYETGKLNYDIKDTDKVYIDACLTTITDGVIPTAVYADKSIGDTLVICVVSEDGALTILNVTLKSQYELIETQAYYDAAADKIYYTDNNGATKTIQGSADASFSYVADAENSYALADYTSGSLVTNVNYKYADSVHFNTDASYTTTSNQNSFGYLMDALQPKIKHESGTLVASIPYNAHTDEYTGVTLMVTVGDITYKFTDTVITSQMIDNATELDAIFNNADMNRVTDYLCVLRTASITKYGTITKGVYMLANDIDCSTGFTFDNSSWNYFEGIFDGRGHNIYNLDVSGTEAAPGNGLFSATSIYSAIQNVGFINVTANYGSVFQGNMYDYSASANTSKPTYYMVNSDSSNNWVGSDGDSGLGSIYYRRQLVDSSDSTTTIGELLKSGARGHNSWQGQGGYFSNVYVHINPATQRLMGVISRNMVNSVNTVRAYNMVIEYKPTKLYDSAEGANDGALPFGYDYTNGIYGVLFGGAYEKTTHSGVEYEYGDLSNSTFFVPDSTVESILRGSQTKGALLFNCLSANTTTYHQGRVHHSTKVYVISPVGLVGSAKGSILGTNETVSDANPYAFVSDVSKLWNTNSVYTRLERYDDYTVVSGKTSNDHLTSYKNDDGAELNYWDISNGYLKWKNVKATTEA